MGGQRHLPSILLSKAQRAFVWPSFCTQSVKALCWPHQSTCVLSSGRCTASPLESRYSGCPSGQGKAVLRKSPTPLPQGWLRPRLHLRCLPLCATFHTFQGTSGPWWIRTEAGSSVRDLITLCHPLLQHSQRGFLDCKFPTSDVQLLTLTDRKLRATMKRQVALQTVLLRSILTGDILLWVV